MKSGKVTKWGLALSGGGARGIIHVGVLQALDEAGIRPACIAGTSMGAIVGGLYAGGVKPKAMLEMLSKKSWYRMFGLKASFSGLLRLTYLQTVLEELLTDDFKELEMPFFVGTTNLTKRTYEVFASGSLHQAIMASASIPVIFAPVVIGESKYVDGGVINNVPSAACKGLCDKILGVDVNNVSSGGHVENMKSIAVEIFNIVVCNNSKEGLQGCDAIIRPDLGHRFDMLDFSKNIELYQIGYDSCKNWIESLRNQAVSLT